MAGVTNQNNRHNAFFSPFSVDDPNRVVVTNAQGYAIASEVTYQQLLAIVEGGGEGSLMGANNGLSLDGSIVQLGGVLITPTVIDFGPTTLSFLNVPTGATSDELLTMDGSGVIGKIATSLLTYTADNGLTKTGNNIQLGGVLIEETTITANDFNLMLGGHYEFPLAGNRGYVNIQNSANLTTIIHGDLADNRYSSIFIEKDGFDIITSGRNPSDVFSQTGFDYNNAITEGIVVIDDIQSKGLRYRSDYSPNNTGVNYSSRWIPDQGYNDSRYATISSLSSYTPTSRILNINGNDLDLSLDREWRVAQGDTGCLTSVGLTANSGTTINVGAVEGYVVDNETDPANPVYTKITYAGETNKTVTTIGSGLSTYVMLGVGGVISFQNTFPTSAERKAKIWLGKVGHPSGTITTVINEPDFITSPQAFSRDLFQALGPYINSNVYPYANGANLSVNITAGSIRGNGINFVGSVANRQDPDKLNVGPFTPVTFLYRTRTGVGGAGVTLIDPTNYDLAGTITAIGGGANRSTIQYMFCVPGVGFVFQYGQNIYNTLTDAVSAIGRESFTVFSNLPDNAILIGVLAVKRTATSLNDETQAHFFNADKLGQIIGATSGVSVGTMQTGYNNSLAPQITTSTTLGAIQYKRGSAADTDNVLQILNGAGTATFSVTGDGLTTEKGFITSGSFSAVANLAKANQINNTLVATANNDVLVGLDITPAFTNGAFTGVKNIGIRLANNDSRIVIGTGIGVLQGSGSFSVSDTKSTLNRHGFDDYSTLNPSLLTTDGYASYDAKLNITNANHVGHIAGYQFRPQLSGAGGVTQYVHGHSTDGVHNGGLITENAGVYVRDMAGTGAITSNYGIYIKTHSRGGKNYNIYSESGFNYFQGSVETAYLSAFQSNLYYQSGWKYRDNGTSFALFSQGNFLNFYTAPVNASGVDVVATPVNQMAISQINGNVLMQNGGTFTNDNVNRLQVNGSGIFKGGAEALKVSTATGNPDHAYLGFYARTASPTTQSGYVGYNGVGTTTLSVVNSIANGNLLLGSGAASNIQLFGATRNVTIQNGGTFTDNGYRLEVVGVARATGGVETGTASATGYIQVNGVVGVAKPILFLTAGINRWVLRGSNADAESGSNAGSNFEIRNHNDAGGAIGTAFYINRASGNVIINGTSDVEVTNKLQVVGSIISQFGTKSSDPVAADIPAGYSKLYKNTTSGVMKLWANDGGTLKSVTLT